MGYSFVCEEILLNLLHSGGEAGSPEAIVIWGLIQCWQKWINAVFQGLSVAAVLSLACLSGECFIRCSGPIWGRGAQLGPTAAAAAMPALLVSQLGRAAAPGGTVLQVQDLCTAIPDTAVPLQPQTTSLMRSAGSQLPLGALRGHQGNRGCDCQREDPGMWDCCWVPSAQIVLHLSVFTLPTVLRKTARGNQFLCVFFPPSSKMWFCTKHWKANWDQFWASTSLK